MANAGRRPAATVPVSGTARRRLLAVVLAAAAGITLVMTLSATPAATQGSSPGAGPTASPEAGDEGLVTRGRNLFGDECATCHAIEGRGIEGQAPAINSAPPALIDFVIRTGRMPLPDPNSPSVRRPPTLTAEQRRAIVAYVKTFAPNEPAIPEVEPDRAGLAHGREIYESNCIACHSAFGKGIAVSQTDIAPGLEAASPVEVAEAIRVGPGVMPVFGSEVLDEDDVNAVIAYINFLEDRPSPGGLTFGRSGPVTEGLIAWGLGLSLLLVAIYLIGERRV